MDKKVVPLERASKSVQKEYCKYGHKTVLLDRFMASKHFLWIFDPTELILNDRSFKKNSCRQNRW